MTATLTGVQPLPPAPKRAPPLPSWQLPLIIKQDSEVELKRYLEQKPQRLSEQDIDGKTLLMLLIEGKALNCIRFVFEKTAANDLDAKDKQQRTSLHYLCTKDFPDLVEQFLARGADPREVDQHGASPLHLAIAQGNLKVIAALKRIPSLAPLDLYYACLFKANTLTPLHVAAGMSPMHLQEVLPLTKAIDTKNPRGWTALHFAVVGEFARENVPLLLQSGASAHIIDEQGQTALSLACQRELPEIASLLLSEKSTLQPGQIASEPMVQAFLHDDISLAKRILKHRGDPNALWGRYKLLDIVAALGERAFVDALIASKATPTEFSRSLATTPITAEQGDFLQCCRKSPLVHCAKLLQTKQIDFSATDAEGNNAFHIALKRGDLLLLALLLGKLPKKLLNMPNKKGETVLHSAIQMGLKPFIELLLRCGADPNRANQKGMTALHLLSQVPFSNPQDYGSLIAFILKKGGKLESKSEDDQTPLELAVAMKNATVVECLLSAGANPDVEDKNGHSLLVRVSEQNLFDTARKLVMFGAKRDCKGQRTPLIAACFAGNMALVQLLLERKVPTIRKKSKKANPNHGPKNETALTATIKKIATLERDIPPSVRERNPLLEQAYTILQLLLQNRARSNKSIQISNKERATPLLLATQLKLAKVVSTLLEFGADPNRKPMNRKCARPLKVACLSDDVAIAKILIDRGAKVKESLRKNVKLSKNMRALLGSPQAQTDSLAKAVKRDYSRTPFIDNSVEPQGASKAVDEDSDSYASQSSVSSEASETSDDDVEAILMLLDQLQNLTMLRPKN